MNETDKAYAAGLLDGEGCLIIRASEHTWVSVAGQHLPTLLFLQERWKGSIVNHGRVYKWQLSRKTLITTFLVDVLPYLRIKADHAKNMIAYCEVHQHTPADSFAAEGKRLNHFLSDNFVLLKAPLKWVDKQPSTESKGNE